MKVFIVFKVSLALGLYLVYFIDYLNSGTNIIPTGFLAYIGCGSDLKMYIIPLPGVDAARIKALIDI